MTDEADDFQKIRKWLLIGAALFSSILISFFVSRKIYYRSGFNAGAVFADTSGYKHGYRLGFEQGYELRDSIAKKEKDRNAPEQLYLNVIHEEIANPQKFISISGKVERVKVKGAARSLKSISGVIKSSANYARYRDIVVRATFLDSRKENIGELNVDIDEVLYPQRTIAFEITEERVPEITEEAKFEMQNALAID